MSQACKVGLIMVCSFGLISQQVFTQMEHAGMHMPAEQMPVQVEAPVTDALTTEEPMQQSPELPEDASATAQIPETYAEELPSEQAAMGKPELSGTDMSEQQAMPDMQSVDEKTIEEQMPAQDAQAQGMPQPPMPVDKETQEEKEIGELVAIDTTAIEQPQGNWLFKRYWWEQAEAKYEKIRALQEEILEFRVDFYMQRSMLDKDVLDPFYINIGLDQGRLEAVIDALLNKVSAEQQKEGILSPIERELREKLRNEKQNIERLQKNIQMIQKFDHDLDEALSQLMTQINRIRNYERDAWENFKAISRVLNDKKAREMFFKITRARRNIRDVVNYIKEPFKEYFDKLIETIKQQIDQANKTMQLLQKKGIDLEQESLRLEKPEPIEQPVQEMPKPKKKVGWFTAYIINPISSFFSAIGNGVIYIIRLPYDLIFGKKPAPKRASTQNEPAALKPEERI